MRRSAPSGPRGVLEVDWPFFGEICRALALRVARDYQPEIVLGVAKAGVIPGVVVASILQCEFASMTVTRREDGAAPVLVAGPPATIRGRRILVVDETCIILPWDREIIQGGELVVRPEYAARLT